MHAPSFTWPWHRLLLAAALSMLLLAGLGVAAYALGSAAPARPLLYRVVGCRSSGVVAHREGPDKREVAIGFDDGPWSDTPAFVGMLEHSHARATFFMIGRQVTAQYRSTMLRELRDGDVLGDHTFTHPDLITSDEVRDQLLDTIGAIRALTGYTPCVFRPPYGDYDEFVLRTARSLGLSTILWNVDPADYTLPGTAAIEQRVLAHRDGARTARLPTDLRAVHPPLRRYRRASCGGTARRAPAALPVSAVRHRLAVFSA